MNRYNPRPTSLPLIVLTLVAGIALGWLLHDMFRGPPAQVALPAADDRTGVPLNAPTSTPQPTSPPATAIVALPTAMPELPTATAEPPAASATPEPPSVTPEQPSATPEPPKPTAAPIETEIGGYIGHTVAEGETLDLIAERAGSSASLIARYNRLSGQPPVGRTLILPQLAGQQGELTSEPLLVKRGRSDQPWVALTLDAGASAEPVPRMLDELRHRNIKITFFLTGKWIAENPDLAVQIVEDGHEIANHSNTHPDFTTLDDQAIREELARTEELMQEATGVTTRPLFRPPYGAYNEHVLHTLVGEGYLPIYWTLDSLDSVGEPKTPEFLVERVTGTLTPEQLRGAIILAHCGSAPTADALPQILDRFAELGLEVKTVSEVLGS